MENVWKNYGKTMEWVRAPEGSKTIQTMENYGKLWENYAMGLGPSGCAWLWQPELRT